MSRINLDEAITQLFTYTTLFMLCIVIVDLSLLRSDHIAYYNKTEQLARDYTHNLNSDDALL